MSCCGHKPKKTKSRPKFKHLKPKVNLSALNCAVEKTFLMCRPTHYGLNYSINPWMNLSNKISPNLAKEQWDNLCDRIVECGGSIRYIKERPNLPDMVFTANGGLVLKDKCAIVSNFRHSERKGEEEWFVQWFAEEGWDFIYPANCHEGSGDALFLNGTLLGGTGFRSEVESHSEVEKFFGKPVVVLKLVDPNFYHLDTCFCPLKNGDYMIYPPAFDTDSIQSILEIQKTVPNSLGIVVPKEEAFRFACNVIRIDDNVILPSGCPITMQSLSDRGYNPVPVEMSEFIKAGGACRCLTLEL